MYILNFILSNARDGNGLIKKLNDQQLKKQKQSESEPSQEPDIAYISESMHSLSQSASLQGPDHVLLGLPQNNFASTSTHKKKKNNYNKIN